MIRDRLDRRASRWNFLPGLITGAPPFVLGAVGAIALVLGVLIVTRPLTSLLVLTIYVGLSAIFSGVAELVTSRSERRLSSRLIAGMWIVLGLAILIGLGRALDLVPDLLAALLIIGGLASLVDVFTRGVVSQRVLAAAWSATQLVFGILAFTWPDVTVLVVAVVFGVRTMIFGVTLIVRALRTVGRARSDEELQGSEADAVAAARRKVVAVRVAVGRYALSALLIAVASAGWWLNDYLSAGAPTVDAFYDPPSDVPREHGALIRTDEFVGQHPQGGDVSRILYTTRDELGRPAVASALVIVPEVSRPGARPVVVWNHGTTGVARGCAPSLRDAAATRWSIPAVEEALARGWVVVASDYSGQGAPGVFPYLIGRGEAQSSLDAVLAASELPGVALSPRTVLWGHSQGGHAALWSSQIGAEYAPTLEILGTAVLAPVTDPLAIAEELASGEANVLLSILISWVLVPYADTYPDVDLRRYLTPGATTIVREMTQRCPTEPGVMVSIATGLGVSEDRPLYVGDLTAGALGDRLAANAPVGPWDAPLLVTWGDADEVIPPRFQEEFVQGLCAEGVAVRWVVFEGYDHLATLLPPSRFLPVLVNWTEARLNGFDTPVDDCGR